MNVKYARCTTKNKKMTNGAANLLSGPSNLERLIKMTQERNTPRTDAREQWIKRDMSYKAPEQHAETTARHIALLFDDCRDLEVELGAVTDRADAWQEHSVKLEVRALAAEAARDSAMARIAEFEHGDDDANLACIAAQEERELMRRDRDSAMAELAAMRDCLEETVVLIAEGPELAADRGMTPSELVKWWVGEIGKTLDATPSSAAYMAGVRDRVIEECAKVCDKEPSMIGDYLGDAIRALKAGLPKKDKP